MSVAAQHPFSPIVFPNTTTLILGSFPSIKSFENNFYYAHPSNQFWKILSTITEYPINNQDQKIWLLKENRFGLWDMIQSCKQENSLDSSLSDEVVNDIPSLLEQYPTITKVAFTGRKAQALFEVHFDGLDVEQVYLPSPSSAYAAMAFKQKAILYKERL